MIYCTECGKQQNSQNTFCINCGKRLTKSLNKFEDSSPSLASSPVQEKVETTKTNSKLIFPAMIMILAIGLVLALGFSRGDFNPFLQEQPLVPLSTFLLDAGKMSNPVNANGQKYYYGEDASIINTEECTNELFLALVNASEKESRAFNIDKKSFDASLWQDVRRFDSAASAKAAYLVITNQVKTMQCMNSSKVTGNSTWILEWSPIQTPPENSEGIYWTANYFFDEVPGCSRNAANGATTASAILNGRDLYVTEVFASYCKSSSERKLARALKYTNMYWQDANSALLSLIANN